MIKIGHRGAAGYEVENTAKSLEKALALKVDMIELDVHQCASGELVVFHDKKVRRITKAKGSIRKKTLEEIKKIHTCDEQEILTLIEALQIIDGRCIVNIEIKHRGVANILIKTIEQLIRHSNWQWDKFIFSSFRHKELVRLKNYNQNIKIGLLYGLLYRGYFRSIIKKAKKTAAFSVHGHKHFMKKKFIEVLRENDIKFFVWTVNKPEEITLAKELGVDGVVTDYPDLF
ncbi:MAG TPA: glycerophosphodiester phosphodiesterase family protein [Candidatus Magasanikbacteria bacterium]|nr:glycerophosphodiester phosphodiesterase family protein [Candidatus Magasanikbacteria bacterium]